MNWSTIVKFLLIISTVYGITALLRNKRQHEATTVGDTLVVGTNSEYPPYSFIQNNEIVGLDIDIITHIAHRLGKKIELQDMSFSALIPQLHSGRIHVIAAGMTKNPEREKHVLFTQPHLLHDALIVITKANKPAITSIDDLMNKDVVVNEGFTADTFISNLHGPRVTRLGTVADAFLALNSDRADVFVTAQSAVKDLLAQAGVGTFATWKIPNTTEEYVFVVSKQYPQLLKDIQRVLDEMREDGTLETIVRKWNLA